MYCGAHPLIAIVCRCTLKGTRLVGFVSDIDFHTFGSHAAFMMRLDAYSYPLLPPIQASLHSTPTTTRLLCRIAGVPISSTTLLTSTSSLVGCRAHAYCCGAVSHFIVQCLILDSRVRRFTRGSTSHGSACKPRFAPFGCVLRFISSSHCCPPGVWPHHIHPQHTLPDVHQLARHGPQPWRRIWSERPHLPLFDSIGQHAFLCAIQP